MRISLGNGPPRRISTFLAGLAVFAWWGAWGWFVYVAPSRLNPDPALDRVHAWPDHGTYVYLSRAEDLALKATGIGTLVLFLSAVVIESRGRRPRVGE